MAEKRKTIVDFGLAVLRDLLNQKASPAEEKAGPPPKVTLEDIKLDDLKRERVRLDQEERKLLVELRELEAQKRKLFEEGVRTASEREQLVIARRIQTLEQQARNKDRMMQALSKQGQIIEGLVQIKERARVMQESGLTSLLGVLDLQELMTYISKASVDGEFQIKKFEEILYTLGQADALSPQIGEDKEVLEIQKQFQLAREAADSPELLEQRYQEFTRQMEAKAGQVEEE